MSFTHALCTNNYGPAKIIVSSSAANGTHTTLASALSAASNGDTIFLRSSVTEDNTITKAVNIVAWPGDDNEGNISITGKNTISSAITVTFSNIRLITNSDNFLAVTGSAASIINLESCNLSCTNNTGISFTTSSSSSRINIFSNQGDLGTTGIAFHSSSSSGQISYSYCNFSNTGASTTVSNNSAGSSFYEYCFFASPIGSTSTGGISCYNSYIDTSAQNATALTANGSGTSGVVFSNFLSGSASAVLIGGSLTFISNEVSSTNANAIDGAGTINNYGTIFTNLGKKINTTTQTISGTIQGSVNASPTAGFLGQSISSSATSVATTSDTAKTITSISLTAGIWDVSAMSTAVATGGTTAILYHICNISTTNNTLTGSAGVEYSQINVSSSTLSGCVAQYRVALTATTTTYYLVVQNGYTSTTCPTNGRISATRVG